MTLQFLSAPVFWTGLVGLAGLLYALQRLRVRHREVVVPTLLFWREAAMEAPARVLVERFRHPLAYALALWIAASLWLALAGPRPGMDDDGVRTTIVVDASAPALRPGRLAAASAEARVRAARLPAARRHVVAAGATARTLLAPGEPAALLGGRLAALAAEPSAPSLRATAARLAATSGAHALVVLGDVALDPDGLERERVRVLQPELARAEDADANAGVVALGLTDAASGDPSRVDALVAVAGDAPPGLWLDGAPLDALEALAPRALAGTRVQAFVARDLPAGGGRLEAAVPGGDALSADDRAERRLPERGPTAVWVDPSLPPEFARAVDVDPWLRRRADADDAAVLVRAEGTAAPADRPALVVTSAATQAEPVLLTHAPGRPSAEVLAELVPRLGLDRLDADALAAAAGVPFAVGAAPGDVPAVGLWRELLDPSGANLAASRAFPVLVGRALRWLGARDAVVPEIAVGRPLALPAPLSGSDGSALAVAGAEPRAFAARTIVDGAGFEHAVPLLSLEASAPARAQSGADVEAELAALADPDTDWAGWLLGAVLVLLLVEHALVRSGRMP